MNILSNLDLFGIQPSLTINNVTKFKSIQGFLITLIAISITILAAVSPVNNWLYRLNPIIVQETKLNPESVLIGGSKNPIYLGFRCVDIMTTVNFSMGQLDVLNKQISPPSVTHIVLENGGLKSKKEINFDKCDQDGFLMGYAINSSLFCLSDEIELYNRNSNNDSSFLLVQFDRSDYTDLFYASSGANCGISLMYHNTYLDSSDYDQYVKLDFTAEEIMAKPSPEVLFQTLTFKKQAFRKKLPLMSASSYEEQIYSTLDRSTPRAQINPPSFFESQTPIMLLTLEFSAKQDTYYIKYFEFEDLVSTIGGTFGLIITLLRVVSSQLNIFPLKAHTMNSIFKYYRFEPSKSMSSKSKIKDEPKEMNIKQAVNDIQRIDENCEIKENIGNESKLPRRFTIIKDLLNQTSKDKVYETISSYDLFKIKKKFKKSLPTKENFIYHLEEYIMNSSNIVNISKYSYFLNELSRIVLGSSFSKYLGPQEFNLDSEANLNFFNEINETIFSNRTDFKANEELTGLAENKETNDIIKNYIIDKFEISNK